MSATAEPARVLINTAATSAGAGAGAIWKLEESGRDLDANLIALPPGDGIAAHDGPDLDVLVHVVAGTGRLDAGTESIELAPGTLVWLPRRSRRGFAAGPQGLRYLTVHQRRRPPALTPTFRQSDDPQAGSPR